VAVHLSTEQIGAENYRFLQRHVYAHSGIVVDSDKQYLFECRLSPIVRELGLGSINDLCALIQATRQPHIGRRVAEAMTTNETYFFRDPAHYEAIRTALLPELLRQGCGARRLRFWSAASSSGQEAYSLAMLLLEAGLAEPAIEILGTDYSSAVLERARAGRYQQIEVNRGLPAPLLVKYFQRAGVHWQISPRLRQMVRFEPIDLREPMYTRGPFDLVFCRNVLIYFDTETKRRILRGLHGTLFRGGWLLLGGSETAFGFEEWFDRRSVAGATVYVAR
jgi:chemotaxis protein methyltransferase CheR